jgi:hypothetical protein
MKRALEERAYRVLPAETGGEAIEVGGRKIDETRMSEE